MGSDSVRDSASPSAWSSQPLSPPFLLSTPQTFPSCLNYFHRPDRPLIQNCWAITWTLDFFSTSTSGDRADRCGSRITVSSHSLFIHTSRLEWALKRLRINWHPDHRGIVLLHGLRRKMNSLNILSSRVIGPTTPDSTRPRSRSQGEILFPIQKDGVQRGRSFSDHSLSSNDTVPEPSDLVPTKQRTEETDASIVSPLQDEPNEKTPLLQAEKEAHDVVSPSRLRLITKSIVDALTVSLRVVFSTLSAPVVYVVTCFRDDEGHYSPLLPLKKIRASLNASKRSTSTASAIGFSGSPTHEKAVLEKTSPRRGTMTPRLRNAPSNESLSSTTSESETDRKRRSKQTTADGRQTRSKTSSLASQEEGAPTRRSIRIKEDTLKRRKQKKENGSGPSTGAGHTPELTVENIKSPVSPAQSSKLTKYPHAPTPPRPLIPRRQPSYTNTPLRPNSRLPNKTLVLDLDETLIHSLAKGGRMSSGHMVEVKLNAPVGFGNATIGPQHPILYYVHKRPHCDEFLRKVCKWYKLVIFTASVQEYADPVIDWLEQERKFFVGRYYRQHCTFRNGAYIKDLSSVEPDLSKVMILDNSPMSYIFHEGNSELAGIVR